MGSAKVKRFIALGLCSLVVAANIWVLSQIYRYFEQLITLLAVSAILALLLNYPVRWLEKLRLNRSLAVSMVLLATVTLLVISGFTLIPIIQDQTAQLVSRTVKWLENSPTYVAGLEEYARSHKITLNLQEVSTRLIGQIEKQLEPVTKQALGLAIGTVNSLINSILVLVLAFYMLLDGDRFWRGLVSLLPRKMQQPLSQSLQQNFHNFFVSQLVLAVVMVVVLLPVFIVLKVPFILLFTLVIGVAELIPFVGPALGIGIVSLLLVLQNPGLGLQVCVIATLLQQLRDNLLAPRMMGSFTGLNPIVILVALMIGGQLAGFLGILVAIPIAGTIKGTFDAMQMQKSPAMLLANAVGEPEERDHTEEPFTSFL
jgi:predicted PurR-regulated permease PerM